eukprot:gene12400-biopygen3041
MVKGRGEVNLDGCGMRRMRDIITAAMMESLGVTAAVSCLTDRSSIGQLGRGAKPFRPKRAHVCNNSMIDVGYAYRLMQSVRQIESCQVPQAIYSGTGSLLQGQAMADWWAAWMNARGRRLTFDWDAVYTRTLGAMPAPSLTHRQSMASAVRIPTFCVWKRRLREYSVKSSYGPNMATNAHLRLASDAELRVMYDGLVRNLRLGEPLSSDQLLAFVRVLFKSKNPLLSERWRTLVLQARLQEQN